MRSFAALAVTMLLIAMFTPLLMAQTGPTVRFGSINAAYEAESVQLHWNTASEADNLGFIISRSDNDTANFEMIASHLSEPELAGHPATTDNSYSYRDRRDLVPGHTYHYQIQDVSTGGTIGRQAQIVAVTVPVMTLSPVTEDGYRVGQNIPNPAHSITRIPFGAPSAGMVRITVFDDRGRELASYEVNVSEGMNTIDLDVSRLRAGNYLYQIKAATTILSRVMTIAD